LIEELIKSYSVKTIDELIKSFEAQQFDTKPVFELIEDLRQDYRKLKFHPHGFLFRQFGLQADLNKIDACIAEAELLLSSIKAFNLGIATEAEQYKKSIGRKWHGAEIPTHEIFATDTSHLKTEAYRKRTRRRLPSSLNNLRISAIKVIACSCLI
jgi:hypothetical protein